MSFLHTDIMQVVEILPQVRQEFAYSTQSVSWVLMSWRRKEPRHQQPWYWLWWTGSILSPHVKGWMWNFQKNFRGWYFGNFLWTHPYLNADRASLMIRQHWFRLCFGVIRQRAITWININQVAWWHMALPGAYGSTDGHEKLRECCLYVMWSIETTTKIFYQENHQWNLCWCLLQEIWNTSQQEKKTKFSCRLCSWQYMCKIRLWSSSMHWYIKHQLGSIEM